MPVINWSGILSAPIARPVLEEPGEDLVLDVRDLRMRYGRTDVLNGVTFSARRGEVLARVERGRAPREGHAASGVRGVQRD